MVQPDWHCRGAEEADVVTWRRRTMEKMGASDGSRDAAMVHVAVIICAGIEKG